MAFANVARGPQAWPLLGALCHDTIDLRSPIANFSRPQKNWMPFEYERNLYLEYSIQPHVVLKFNPATAECTEQHSTMPTSKRLPDYLHGGAPALRLNDDYFLGVGNSQHLYWFQERYYAAMFYLFEAKPPFRIIKVTSPLRMQSRVERIQYVCGLAFGEFTSACVASRSFLPLR